MSSVPTTEDLKYALAEAKKHRKMVELPFENPNTKLSYIIRVQIGIGVASPPHWTFIRGDKVLWTRDSGEVMMVQSKVKTESAYTGEGEVQQPQDSGETLYEGASSYDSYASQSTSQPIILGAYQPAAQEPPEFGGGPPAASSASGWTGFGAPQPGDPPFGSPPPSEPPFGAPQVPPPFAAQQPPPFGGPIPPAFGAPAQPQFGGPQAPPFGAPPAPAQPAQAAIAPQQGSQGAGLFSAFAPMDHLKAQWQVSPQEPQPSQPSAPAAQPQASGGQSAAPISPPSAPGANVQLPPPVEFDTRVVESIYSMLTDQRTETMSFGAFVFFLSREYVRYQTCSAPFAVVTFEIAVRQGEKVMSLPPEAIIPVSQRIRSIASQIDVVTHVSGSEFVILLHSTDGAGALRFSEVLYRTLTESPLLPNLSGPALVAIGAASIPETCEHPGVLVAAARQAKQMAKRSTPPYLLFP